MKKESKTEETTTVKIEPVNVIQAEVNKGGNIYARMQNISREIGTIAKNLTVGKGPTAYKALADADVIERVKEMEQRYGVISVPGELTLIESKEVKALNSSGNEDVIFVDTIKMKWEFVNVDRPSDRLTVETIGRGMDYGDKGLNKAMTYARKYALLNAYKIGASSEEDPEGEKSEKKAARKIDEMLILIENYTADKPDEIQKIYRAFGVNDLSELDDKDIKAVYLAFHKKGKI